MGITQVSGAVEGGREILTDLLALPGVQVIQGIDFNWALTFWPGQLQDFGDALVVAAVQVRKEAQVVTFDKRLISSLQKLGINIASR